jgi:hypothetical protein
VQAVVEQVEVACQQQSTGQAEQAVPAALTLILLLTLIIFHLLKPLLLVQVAQVVQAEPQMTLLGLLEVTVKIQLLQDTLREEVLDLQLIPMFFLQGQVIFIMYQAL